jgi:hypothetical protein
VDEIDLVLFTSAQELEWTALADSFVRETFLFRAGAACRLSPVVTNAFMRPHFQRTRLKDQFLNAAATPLAPRERML